VARVADHPAPDELRFGLVGTGYWARIAHAAALASTPGVRLAAVWGRSPDAAAALAARHQASAHADFDAFLADVDAVAFSVPPDVQCELATRAARAGRHLLLDKPAGTDPDAAAALAQAAADAGVASVVFFTARFDPRIRAWLANAQNAAWTGGQAVWLGSALDPASPFNTPWRREKGGLWDLGPHAVSVLWACLGPVTSVTADGGPGDVAHLVLHHERGATSTVTVTVSAPPSLDGFDLLLWGEPGKSVMPGLGDDPAAVLRVAVTELAANARSGRPAHPCDVHFGAQVTRVLADAQQQLDALRARA
jgi:predicted dehydrogenase